MSCAGASARFETVGTTLSVRGEINFEDEDAFADALGKLFALREDAYTIDLSGVSFMGSSCVRVVAAAIVSAGKAPPAVRIVARAKILRLFELAGLAMIGCLELVEME
jgi:anti-anti-sigma factor